MKTIPLSKGKVALVDDADYEALCAISWSFYKGYAYGCINGKTTLMHRFIMKPSADQHIDHKNGDGVDNRRENLRYCTVRQNARNRRMRSDNSSGFKGVDRREDMAKYGVPWRAKIKVNGKSIHIGFFATKEEAAAKYDAKANELFGEFARPNVAA